MNVFCFVFLRAVEWRITFKVQGSNSFLVDGPFKRELTAVVLWWRLHAEKCLQVFQCILIANNPKYEHMRCLFCSGAEFFPVWVNFFLHQHLSPHCTNFPPSADDALTPRVDTFSLCCPGYISIFFDSGTSYFSFFLTSYYPDKTCRYRSHFNTSCISGIQSLWDWKICPAVCDRAELNWLIGVFSKVTFTD